MQVHFEYDGDNDLLYVVLSKRAFARGAVKRTVRVSEDVALDFDADGRLLGIDIMNATRPYSSVTAGRS